MSLRGINLLELFVLANKSPLYAIYKHFKFKTFPLAPEMERFDDYSVLMSCPCEPYFFNNSGINEEYTE